MKEAIRIQEGEKIDLTLAAATDVGDVIPIGTGMIAIASTSGLTGEVVAGELEGVYEINAATADEITLGAEVFFDATNREITTVATNNTRAGRAVSVKAAAAAGAVSVLINVA